MENHLKIERSDILSQLELTYDEGNKTLALSAYEKHGLAELSLSHEEAKQLRDYLNQLAL